MEAWGSLGVAAISAIVAAVVAILAARIETRKLEEQMKLEFAVETALRKLLENENYKSRTLKKIKYHVRGFENDNELRMALLRSGAVVVKEQSGKEYWGLLSRNEGAVR